MNLDDLEVRYGDDEPMALVRRRPVTISDLKEVLANLTPEQAAELGGWQVTQIHMDASFGAACLEVKDEGRYLVVKL